MLIGSALSACCCGTRRSRIAELEERLAAAEAEKQVLQKKAEVAEKKAEDAVQTTADVFRSHALFRLLNCDRDVASSALDGADDSSGTYRGCVRLPWTDDLDRDWASAAQATPAADVAADALSGKGYFEDCFAEAPEFVRQGRTLAEVMGTAHFALTAAWSAVCKSVLDLGICKPIANLLRQAAWAGDKKLEPDYTSASPACGDAVNAIRSGLPIEVKGNIPMPKGIDHAAAAAKAAASRELPVGSRVALPHTHLKQREKAFAQVVSYLAHGAWELLWRQLALPFYRSFGVAVCGAHLRVIALTVEGHPRFVRAENLTPTGELVKPAAHRDGASAGAGVARSAGTGARAGAGDIGAPASAEAYESTAGGRVVISATPWLPFLPCHTDPRYATLSASAAGAASGRAGAGAASPSPRATRSRASVRREDPPPGLVWLARIIMSDPDKLCPVISSYSKIKPLLPADIRDLAGPLAPLGSGSSGLVFRTTLRSSASGSAGVALAPGLGNDVIAVKIPMSATGSSSTAKEVAALKQIHSPPWPDTWAASAAALALALDARLSGASTSTAAGAGAGASSHSGAGDASLRLSWPQHVAHLRSSSPQAIALGPVGVTLLKQLQSCGCAEDRVAMMLTFLPHIVRALVHCHARGVQHRDLRAANVIVVPVEGTASATGPPTTSEHAVLIDFGEASRESAPAPGTASDAYAKFGAFDVASLIVLCADIAKPEWDGYGDRDKSTPIPHGDVRALHKSSVAALADSLTVAEVYRSLMAALGLASPSSGGSAAAPSPSRRTTRASAAGAGFG